MKTRAWLVSILFGVMACNLAYAGAVGLVLDISGSVRADASGRKKVIDIATALDPGTHLDLDKGSEISFVFYPTRQIFTAVGPSALQITEQTVKQLQGAAMKFKDLPENRIAVSLGYQDRAVPAAMPMRNIVLKPRPVEPLEGETVLWERPEFVWTSVNGALLDFSLTLDGATVHQQQIDSNRLVLPAGLSLLSGREYRWQIAFASSDKATTNWGTFTVASASVRQQLQAEQPTADADLADWVLYAMTLDQLKMNTDANRVWRRVADQRPTSNKLHELVR